MKKLTLRLLALILSVYLAGSIYPLLAHEAGHSHAPPSTTPTPPPVQPPPPTSQVPLDTKIGGLQGGPPSMSGGGGCGGSGAVTQPAPPIHATPQSVDKPSDTGVAEGTPDLGPPPSWTTMNTIEVCVGLDRVIKGAGSYPADTMPWRVPRGESCVEASEHRAQLVADEMRNLQKTGAIPPDHSVTVGRVSGYDPGIGSLHTYTVVEIKDKSGNVVKTIEVDNYIGVPLVNPFHSKVDWNDPYNKSLYEIPARK